MLKVPKLASSDDHLFQTQHSSLEWRLIKRAVGWLAHAHEVCKTRHNSNVTHSMRDVCLGMFHDLVWYAKDADATTLL